MNIIPKNARLLLNLLQGYGYEAFVVGGCVRDMLRNKIPHDWDITTSALPETVEKILSINHYKFIETGLKHGTITAVVDSEQYEITTYRQDGTYEDNRHPSNVTFVNDLKEDLSRRDFTINAMAYNTELIDVFGGFNDLQNKIIRAVGEPDVRFKEDALRILRALRFAAAFGFDIEPKTKEAIFKNKKLLLNISKERIQQELSKILLSEHCGNKIFREYIEVFNVIIPELSNIIGFQQHNPHHLYDVWEHTLHCMDAVNENDDLIVRLSVLFHDIGKPDVFSFDEYGVGHFLKHADVSANYTTQILTRLKFSNEVIDKVTELVKYHDISLSNSTKTVKRLLNKLGENQLIQLLLLKTYDVYGQSDYQREDKLLLIQFVTDEAQKIIAQNECFSLKDLAVNGNDLIAAGFKEGKIIGEMLNNILDKVINNELENNKDAILNYIHNCK